MSRLRGLFRGHCGDRTPVCHHFQVRKDEEVGWKIKTARRRSLFANSLHHPVLLAEGTAIVLLHPQGHAAVMEGVVAFSPYH